MKVRTPKFDFSNTTSHWAKTPEFAHMMNASSLWIPHLERFLNRVMAKAGSSLKGDDETSRQVKADIKLFIRQEATHYAMHGAFNQIMVRDGYDVAPFEKMFDSEFEKLFKTKSLAFLCAYCEGFETLGPPSALVWLDEIEEILEGADPAVVALWKWHLTEEYEHRTVCYDTFKVIHGGYFMRIYGFFFQLRQLQGFSKIVREYLLARDRESMTEEEIKASRKRYKMVSRKITWLTLPRMLKALSPFYNPRGLPEPKMFRTHLAKIEAALT
jgi:predicted metal-dependent hydrolase